MYYVVVKILLHVNLFSRLKNDTISIMSFKRIRTPTSPLSLPPPTGASLGKKQGKHRSSTRKLGQKCKN